MLLQYHAVLSKAGSYSALPSGLCWTKSPKCKRGSSAMVPQIAQQNEFLCICFFSFREDDNLCAACMSLIGFQTTLWSHLQGIWGFLKRSHSRQRKPTAVNNNMVRLVLCRVDWSEFKWWWRGASWTKSFHGYKRSLSCGSRNKVNFFGFI